MSRHFKMTTVVDRFKHPETGVPKERLACGHIRTDPALYYDNEKAFQIKRLSEAMSPECPIKARCYRCATEVKL